eukprot:CAMPEP_0180355314 /NCGR_PEP_ID=MMETSP0989-20121125/8710_1 /TAXON_ID=697907 /ORGANISM="non described non described, Strain CCMP2293" /LENGTH=221 /DNA_ID=CAMNT_0022345243 /DNA_START=437 /DNA_END=1099 /DNA_ORIENTATION=-
MEDLSGTWATAEGTIVSRPLEGLVGGARDAAAGLAVVPVRLRVDGDADEVALVVQRALVDEDTPPDRKDPPDDRGREHQLQDPNEHGGGAVGRDPCQDAPGSGEEDVEDQAEDPRRLLHGGHPLAADVGSDPAAAPTCCGRAVLLQEEGGLGAVLLDAHIVHRKLRRERPRQPVAQLLVLPREDVVGVPLCLQLLDQDRLIVEHGSVLADMGQATVPDHDA